MNKSLLLPLLAFLLCTKAFAGISVPYIGINNIVRSNNILSNIWQEDFSAINVGSSSYLTGEESHQIFSRVGVKNSSYSLYGQYVENAIGIEGVSANKISGGVSNRFGSNFALAATLSQENVRNMYGTTRDRLNSNVYGTIKTDSNYFFTVGQVSQNRRDGETGSESQKFLFLTAGVVTDSKNASYELTYYSVANSKKYDLDMIFINDSRDGEFIIGNALTTFDYLDVNRNDFTVDYTSYFKNKMFVGASYLSSQMGVQGMNEFSFRLGYQKSDLTLESQYLYSSEMSNVLRLNVVFTL